jgi:cytochrome c-type biogenesis protein CcmH/NrfG
MSNGKQIASVETALTHAMRLYTSDPLLAAEQARQILLAAPGDPAARLLLGMSHNALGEYGKALEVLQPLAGEQPEAPRPPAAGGSGPGTRRAPPARRGPPAPGTG